MAIWWKATARLIRPMMLKASERFFVHRPPAGVGGWVQHRGARRRVIGRLVVGWCVGLMASGGSVLAVEPDQLQAKVMDELRHTGLVSDAVPVTAFRWLIENKRPMRKPRQIEETFKGQVVGLSPVARRIFDPAGKVETSEYVSARGLIRLDAEDRTIAASIEGLKLPLATGQEFSVAFTRDGHPVRQRCVVGARESAASLHAQLPGTLLGIECKGDGRYAGMKVKVSSRIDFIEALGVFFDRQDVLDSPLGRFENSNRIVEFTSGIPPS